MGVYISIYCDKYLKSHCSVLDRPSWYVLEPHTVKIIPLRY